MKDTTKVRDGGIHLPSELKPVSSSAFLDVAELLPSSSEELFLYFDDFNLLVNDPKLIDVNFIWFHCYF